MGNKRMIHENFFESEDVSEWTLRQRLLVLGIITLADDQGRVRAHPGWLKSRIFPYDDILASEIEADLEAISSTNDTLIIYDAEGKQYIQLSNWWDYQSLQWAKPSDYPAPEGWTDQIRMMIYEPDNRRWVMTQNWPGSEDVTSLKEESELPEQLPNRSPNQSGEGAGDGLALINTTTKVNTDSKVISDVPEVEEAAPTKFSELSVAFVNKTQIPELTGGPRRWAESTRRMVNAGVEPEDIITAVDELLDKNYTIVSIASVENAAISAMAKRKNSKGKSKRDRVMDDSPERRRKYAEDLAKYQ